MAKRASTVRLTHNEHLILRLAADKKGVSVNELIRTAIERNRQRKQQGGQPR